MRNQSAKNVLMRDGTARRMPANEAETKVRSGDAKRYISNTLYRAMKLGIEVTDFNDRDEKGQLKARIQDASSKAKVAKAKADEKRKKKEAELSKMRAAQEVLDDD